MKNFLVLLLVPLALMIMWAGPVSGQSKTYTLDADFETGTLLNVNHDAPNHDQLQLNQITEPFPFVNIAVSNRGTMVRIDANTGAILGEYSTNPDNLGGPNPSRTTVDLLGNVWIGNRNDNTNINGVPHGSVTRIGLIIGGTRVNADGTPNPVGQYLQPPFDYNTCIDRDGDGLIKTSLGLGNILPWPNGGGVDTLGGVSTAEDECIINYVRTPGTGTRTVAIDAQNDVWVGNIFGSNNHNHVEVDVVGSSATLNLATLFNVGCGGYGGFIDGNQVLWSAGRNNGLLRYDLVPNTPACLGTNRGDYGLGLDPNTGHVWQSSLFGGNNRLFELDAAGNVVNSYNQPFNAQGVAVDANGHVWVAELFGSRVMHYAPDPGSPNVLPHVFVGSVPGFVGTTGVSVDANGKIWASENSSSATRGAARIDPSAGPIGGGGYTVGAIDLTVGLGNGGGPYNYSDMTGFQLLSANQQGLWTVICDTEADDTEGCTISWNEEPEGAEPAGTSITVEARAANAEIDLPAEVFIPVTNGTDPGLIGRFIEVQVTLAREPGVSPVTPVLSDLTIQCCEPVEDPDVRTQGFWKRVCKKTHPSGEHEKLPSYVDCVNKTTTFADVGDVDALCDRLNPDPKNAKCEQAEAQFMALLLNVCSGRVAECNCINDPDLGETTVGEAIDFIDMLLSDPGRTFQDCVLAQSIADALNNGLSLVDCP